MPFDWEDSPVANATTDAVIVAGPLNPRTIVSTEKDRATGDGVTTMLRYNAGKLPFGLVPTDFMGIFIDTPDLPRNLLIETTKVLDFGAQKYAPNNWRKGGSWVQVYNSLTRHLILGIGSGEINDGDSGLNHWGHVGCNLAFLLEFHIHNIGTDDRFIRPDGAQFDPQRTFDKSPNDVLEDLLVWLDGGSVDRLVSAIKKSAIIFGETK